MSQLTEEQKNRIIQRLQERGANLPCPRCGNRNFNLLDGFFNQTVQRQLKGMVLGGPSVPSVVVVCDRCGFMSQHALGAIGLLPLEGGS